MQRTNTFLCGLALLLTVTTVTAVIPEHKQTQVLNFRLPNQTEPLHYHLSLTTNVYQGDRSFTGSVAIELLVLENTREIVLHARQLSNFQASAKYANGENTIEDNNLLIDYEEEREFLTLKPSRSELVFEAGTIWTVTIRYSGELRTDSRGFYISTYIDEHGQTHYLATTQFSSTDARHAFPCYDEPAKRANFTITINHHTEQVALSNMPVDEDKSIPGTTVFLTTVRMPTLVLAFIVTDFKYSAGSLHALLQRVYSRPGTMNQQEWALVAGMLINGRLAEYFDFPFALPKMYQVAIPDMAVNAMENWGLITYDESGLFFNKQNSTIQKQTSITTTIAHEHAHQWFGNLVTPKWWTYLWLKEGFANLFMYYTTNVVYPEWDVYQVFHTDAYRYALALDSSNSTRPMTHYAQTPPEIASLFDFVAYQKAGAVLHMFQYALTDAVFQRGMRNYLKENQYNSADEQQVFAALEAAVQQAQLNLPSSISNMLSSWTQQAGYPLLTVERNYNNGAFSVRQQAYQDSGQSQKLWYVPFNYVSQSTSDFRQTAASHYLLKTTQLTVSDAKLSNDDWLLLNKQSTGYFRINYDERNWNLIHKGLLSKFRKIHVLNRAQLLDDAYHFSERELLAHNILLQLMTYLRMEDQYAPWATAHKILNEYNRQLLGEESYTNYEYFVRELVGELYDRLGTHDVPSEQHLQKLTRKMGISVACLVSLEECLAESRSQLLAFIEHDVPIAPELQSTLMCYGLKQSKDSEFDYIYKLMLNTQNLAGRSMLIEALACSQQPDKLQLLVESSIDMENNLRSKERIVLLGTVYRQSELGFSVCIDFLEHNWSSYANLTVNFRRENPLTTDIKGMAAVVTNVEQKDELLHLIDTAADSIPSVEDFKESITVQIDANLRKIARNREALQSWLQRYRSLAVRGPAVGSLLLLTTAALVLPNALKFIRYVFGT